ncbi:MAG: cation transporter [Deltaproteobacteria bacterium]|nr:cation transporter [Deltaproteobacteria bacterium]
MIVSHAPAQDGGTAERRRAAFLSLAVGGVVLAGKIAAYGVTGSTAVLSDAMESVVNVAAAIFLVFSIRLAAQPADRNHPYGHGKIEFLAAGVEGTLILGAAGLILAEAIGDILRGPELHRIGLGLALLAGLTVLNAAMGLYLIRVGKRLNSLALRADGAHLMTDVVTTVGVLVGLLAVRLTGWAYFDPIAAIAVAANILRTGWLLGREAVRGLMDEVDEALLEQITTQLQEKRRPWWIDVHTLRVWHSGSEQHADFHLTVPRYYDTDRLHDIDDELRWGVFGRDESPGDIVVHFDPCRPRHCRRCAVEACPVRGKEPDEPLPFSVADCTRADEILDTGLPVRNPG